MCLEQTKILEISLLNSSSSNIWFMESTVAKSLHQKKACGLLQWCLLLTSLVLLPVVSTADTSSEWDFVVANLNRHVTFFNLLSNENQPVKDLPVPVPLLPDNINLTTDFQVGRDGPTTFYNGASDASTWKSLYFGLVAADRAKNVLYLTAKKGRLSYSSYLASIIMFDMNRNTSYIIRQSDSVVIDKLEFHRDCLYWNENHTIWRVNVSTSEISSWKAELLYSINQTSPLDFTINPVTSTLYYSNSTGKEATIHAIDHDNPESKIVINKGLVTPYALTTDCAYLYWVDHPPRSADYNIYRAEFRNLSNIQKLKQGRHHNVVAIAPLSNFSVIWSERDMQKIFLQRAGKEFHQIENHRSAPRGLTSFYCSSNDAVAATESSGLTPTASASPEVASSPGTSPEKELSSTAATVLPNVTDASLAIAKVTTDTDGLGSDSYDVPEAPVPATTESPVQPTISSLDLELDSSENKHVEAVPNHVDQPANASNVLYPVVKNEEITPSSSKAFRDELSFCSDRGDDTFCLNGGSCVLIHSRKVCLCSENFGGPKCDLELSSCKTGASIPVYHANDLMYQIICSILTFILAVMTIVSVSLYLRVRDYSKKPRIRRRLIVSRTPDSENSTVHEMVDIENCCNMNECETPCYERDSATSSYASRIKLNSLQKKKGSKKGDCERLVEI